MKKSTLRILSGCVCMTMLLTLASCKKKEKSNPLIESITYKSGQEIKETDPYFDLEINPLKLPIDESKEVENSFVNFYNFTNGFAVADYSIEYKIPENADSETLSSEEYMKYNSFGIGIFDDKGNYLTDVPNDCTTLYDADADPDGNICLLGVSLKTDGSGAEMKIVKIDRDGKKLDAVVLQNSPFVPGTQGSALLGFLPDGRYSIQDSGKLHVFDKEGMFKFTISEPERTIGEGVFAQNGKYYVTSTFFDIDKGKVVQIKEVDIKTGALGKSYDASVLAAFDKLSPTLNGLLVNSSTGCYEYDVETAKLTKFFDWSDTDINRSWLAYAPCVPTPQSTDEIYALGVGPTTWPDTQIYLIHITRAEKNPHAGKRMIVVGGINMDYDETLMTFIADYNSNPDSKCRAVLVDYSENLESETSFSEIERKVYLDILAGEGPDILVNFAESSSFQTDAVMEDLNSYLDGAEGISRDMYFDNIFRAQEKDGKLFHIPIRFSLDGLQANNKFIQNTVGWTFEEFEEASANIPDNVSFIEGIEYKDFLTILLNSTMSSFVSFEQKKVDFQNDTMKKYLQLSKQYGVERIPIDEGSAFADFGGGLTNTEVKFMSELIALRKLEIHTIEDYCVSKYSINGNSAFLGYPTPDGSGATVKTDLSVGIVSTSKYKDLAWDFLRAFLAFSGNPNYQTIPEAFSVNRKLFESESQKIMQVNNDYLDRVNLSPEDIQGLRARISEKDIDELNALIEAATTTMSFDTSILDVITEEAAAYFAGDRSEDDVLKNIQNRCDLIVKERG
ncbi:extracellular solute-binding protein [Ruminococcus flavefaciens]|uniref:extracellular solute-binding protein n=1 Tax=Ruminococcus flavefaciens TaxID=1265 RepID=UPI0026E9C73A|nr:extracellular solute-binding protein [Ruminococcus flavefaciens]